MIYINEDFRIEPYSQGWEVIETVPGTKKDGTPTTREVSHHFPTLRLCLRYIVDQDAKGATGLDEVVARIDKINADIDAAFAVEPK